MFLTDGVAGVSRSDLVLAVAIEGELCESWVDAMTVITSSSQDLLVLTARECGYCGKKDQRGEHGGNLSS